MAINIEDNFGDGDASEKNIAGGFAEMPDSVLFRMAGSGEEGAVVELIRRYPELGFGE